MMKLGSIGDLVRSTQLQRDTIRVKGELNRLTKEVTSGQVASLNVALQGQFGPLAGLSRDLALNEATLRANGSAARFATAQQTALGMVQEVLATVGPNLLDAAWSGNDVQRKVTTGAAAEQLEQVITALNVRTENKAVFAGAALDGPALADAETMLTDLELNLTGVTDPAEAVARIAAWFDLPGGGFEIIGYRGAPSPMSEVAIGSGETARLDVTAADPSLRNTLRGLATASLMDRGLFEGDRAAQDVLLRDAGEALADAVDAVTVRRAGLGFLEARIETVRVRTEAESTGLEQARAALLETDPYETALRLQEVQVQLETIYAVTARVANLSLARVLR